MTQKLTNVSRLDVHGTKVDECFAKVDALSDVKCYINSDVSQVHFFAYTKIRFCSELAKTAGPHIPPASGISIAESCRKRCFGTSFF